EISQLGALAPGGLIDNRTRMTPGALEMTVPPWSWMKPRSLSMTTLSGMHASSWYTLVPGWFVGTGASGANTAARDGSVEAGAAGATAGRAATAETVGRAAAAETAGRGGAIAGAAGALGAGFEPRAFS